MCFSIGGRVDVYKRQAVSKSMSNADLIFAAKKMPVVVRSNNTVGLPGHFSSRLQPNDTRDEIPSIVAQVYEGLSYGAGDAVIGINPVKDTVENTKACLLYTSRHFVF